MRNLRGSRVILGAAVILVLAGLYGLAGLRHSLALAAGDATPATRAVAVTSVLRACPSPGSAAGDVALMAAPGRTGPGQAYVNRLAGAGSPTAGPQLLTVSQPGYPRVAGVRTDSGKAAHAQKVSSTAVASTPTRGGVVIHATGAMAQGLDVEQTAGDGLPTASCGSPGTDFWFVGPGQHTATTLQLYLMNASGQAADADVDIFTDAGPVQGTTDTGITVPPHGMVVQALATAVRNSRSVLLHVRTSAGQVVAAVREAARAGQGGWLPAAQAPATHLVLPGLPGTAGSRQLYVAVPGIRDAKIRLTAVTSRGSYEPTGAGGIDIPGGSAVGVALPSLSGIPAAIKLTANVPVTAVAMVSGGAGGAPGAFTAAAPAIEEQGVVADSLTGLGRASVLVLSAPRDAATVRVTEAGQAPAGAAGSGGQAPQVVHIRAGHSTVLPLKAVPGSRRGSAFAVVITPLPGSGPVYAGRVITGSGTGGAVQVILPVQSSLTAVPLPPVRDSLSTAP